ncbi:MAG: HlyD family efflux transporter periplasmic adaptor subunit, partial [Gammaproteobacteria bacterium]|nr:HlyD family efflux transporter periplasmic adaptor subunit [Gammaproteobacteria bacterium]
VGLIALFIYPWQRDIKAPAIWSSAEFSQIYTPTSARVDSILVAPGDDVIADQLLFQLSSPELDFAIRQGELDIQLIDYQLSARSFDADIRQRSRVLLEEREAALTEQNARTLEREKLKITSPIDGQVRDMVEFLSAGDWLPENTLLATIVAPGNAQVEAWVAEADLGRMPEQATGRFFPEDLQQASFPISVSRIAAASSRQITELMVTSDHGGEIAVRENITGELVPENPVYHVLASANSSNAPQQVMRGTVRISGTGESLILRLWNTVVSVFIRESGF